MTVITERIFIIGGTGNVGTKVVNDLLAKNVAITLYSRNPTKVNTLFPNAENLNVVEGDFNDFTNLKEGIKGHTRLFLLVGELEKVKEFKTAIATYAYEAGVKQIVSISTLLAGARWRSNYDGTLHAEAEEAILNIPNRGAFVVLRPGRYMSNIVTYFRPTPEGQIIDIADGSKPQAWVSPNDVGSIAANILTEDIEKHGDCVYELLGDAVTPFEQARIISKITGREFTYHRISALEKYNFMMSLGFFTHKFAYSLVSMDPEEPAVTQSMPILLGREPETLEQYLTSKKDLL
jgi:uncharacterized protein YbjT (DUF2867 family)